MNYYVLPFSLHSVEQFHDSEVTASENNKNTLLLLLLSLLSLLHTLASARCMATCT